MYCDILLPAFLRCLTNTESVISSWSTSLWIVWKCGKIQILGDDTNKS